MGTKVIVIAISAVLLLGNIGFTFTPSFGQTPTECNQHPANFDRCFDGGPGGTGQDWGTLANWDPESSFGDGGRHGIGFDTVGSGPVSFDVNIGDGTIPGSDVVYIDGSGTGHLEINGGSSVTIKEYSTIDHYSGGTIIVHPGGLLTIDGILFNNGPFAQITVDTGGKIVVTATGLLDNTISASISGGGVIENCLGGTVSDPGFGISVTIDTQCQAPVGSVSIPIDSTSMLVAGSEMVPVWITLVVATSIGIGAVVTKKLKD